MQILLTLFRCQRARDALFGQCYQIFNFEEINASGTIPAGNGKLRTIRVESHACESIGSMKREQFLPRKRIPKFCCFICAGGSNGFAIRTEGDTNYIINMAQ